MGSGGSRGTCVHEASLVQSTMSTPSLHHTQAYHSAFQPLENRSQDHTRFHLFLVIEKNQFKTMNPKDISTFVQNWSTVHSELYCGVMSHVVQNSHTVTGQCSMILHEMEFIDYSIVHPQAGCHYSTVSYVVLYNTVLYKCCTE